MLMRLRIAEIDQYAVAHVAGDEPAEPGDGFGHVCLIGDHHLAQILGVEPHRECRRADEVAEHDRELAPLGRGRRRHDGERWWRAGLKHGAALDAGLAAVLDVGLAVRTNHTPPLSVPSNGNETAD